MSRSGARAMAAFLIVLAPACARTPPPWERTAMQAMVALHGKDLEVRGRVTFVRPQGPHIGTVQIDVERAGRLDNATLLASGQRTAFTDGVPRSPSLAEERALVVLAALFAWPGAQAERGGRGASVWVRLADGARYEITIEQETSGDPHRRGG